MAIEQLTPDQVSQATQNLEICKQSASQTAQQMATDAAKKAIDAANQATQQLARLPEEVITSLNVTIQTLLTIINGWEDPSAPNFDPDAVIKKIEALLNPVVETLGSLTAIIPTIPGLAQIADLLAALTAMKSPENPKPGKMPEIPPGFMSVIEDLLAAVQSLCTTLPMCLVNVLFNTVNMILSVGIPVVGLSLNDIIGMVPYVKEIPELVGLAPKIVSLVTQMPGQLKVSVQGKIRKQLKSISDTTVPDIPTDVEVPKSLPACPKRN